MSLIVVKTIKVITIEKPIRNVVSMVPLLNSFPLIPSIVFKAHNLIVTLRNKSQLNTWMKLYPEGTYTIN